MVIKFNNSIVDRQNILNNQPALRYVEQYLDFKNPIIEGEVRFTIKQVAEYYEVDEKTIKRYLDKYGKELQQNGYEIFTGERLQKAKSKYVRDIDVPNLEKSAPTLGFFTFRAFLNVGMLLSESEKAKELRSIVLNIVMDYVNQRGGGTTKYINQNDESFLLTYKDSIYYRKQFTDALTQYVEGGPHKYPYFTDLVYKAIFMEYAKEYKKLFKLSTKDNLRHTLYSEVLNLVSAFENGFSAELKKKGLCSFREAKKLFNEFKQNPLLEPILKSARTIMISRDNAFRDVWHDELGSYLKSVSPEEYERFCREHVEYIGQKSQEFVSIMDQNKDVLIRLKDK